MGGFCSAKMSEDKCHFDLYTNSLVTVNVVHEKYAMLKPNTNEILWGKHSNGCNLLKKRRYFFSGTSTHTRDKYKSYQNTRVLSFLLNLILCHFIL